MQQLTVGWCMVTHPIAVFMCEGQSYLNGIDEGQLYLTGIDEGQSYLTGIDEGQSYLTGIICGSSSTTLGRQVGLLGSLWGW